MVSEAIVGFLIALFAKLRKGCPFSGNSSRLQNKQNKKIKKKKKGKKRKARNEGGHKIIPNQSPSSGRSMREKCKGFKKRLILTICCWSVYLFFIYEVRIYWWVEKNSW
jgi:hypothetical protein